jgi:cell division septum initiation protein DivIVA
LSTDDFYTPTDMDALRMENELLTFETRFLRTQLAERVAERVEELERSAAQLKDRLEESERRLQETERSAAQLRDQLVETERSAEQFRVRAERAEQDIVLLLRRLARGPFGWFFGTKQNFRILERRYLGDDG